MISYSGQKRVIISGIGPQVENGRFPVKAIAGEDFKISASVFCDGHDEVQASILFKNKEETEWHEFHMDFISNDCWEFKAKLPIPGIYEFKIRGWIDHFLTWKKGLIKKINAGLDVHVELEIGAQILHSAFKIVTRHDRHELDLFIANLRSTDTNLAKQTALSPELEAVMSSYINETLMSESPQIYQIEAERSKAEFSTWYELFPRSASRNQGTHGTFRDVIKLLPRIEKMGFDVLYFPPIHPIGEKNRKGKNNSLQATQDDPGSPWAIGNKIGGHKSIHPELGSLQDFEFLVGEAKKFGIEIALDIAFQCAPDHPYVEEHPAWFKWRPDGTVQYAENPPKKYEDILPFNFESEDWEHLWEELKSVLLFWVDKGIEIFRIDNPHTKSFLFWEWAIAEVRKVNKNVLFLAEAFTRPRLMEQLAKGGFDQSYTYFTWRTTKAELEKYVTELNGSELKNYFRPNFWPNTPDILAPELSLGGENAHLIRLILAATLSSNYGLYGPVYEFGINTPVQGKEEYIDNEKYEIKHWDWEAQTKIKEMITRINHIRNQNKALQKTAGIHFAETTNDQIICYGRANGNLENKLIIVVNLDPNQSQSAWVRIPLVKLGLQPDRVYQVHDLLSGSTYAWMNEWNFVMLHPGQMPAHIFTVQQ